jgi:hypothetical protein
MWDEIGSLPFEARRLPDAVIESFWPAIISVAQVRRHERAIVRPRPQNEKSK